MSHPFVMDTRPVMFKVFAKTLHENPEVEVLAERLCKLGCHPWVLVFCLFAAVSLRGVTDQRKREIQTFVKEAQKACKQIKNGMQALAKLRASDLARDITFLQMATTSVEGADSEGHIDFSRIRNLEDFFNAACSDIERQTKAIAKEFISGKNPMYRKELFLVMLVAHLKVVTGRPHYAEVASLLEIAHLSVGNHVDVDPENLEKACVRYDRSYPKIKRKASKTFDDMIRRFESDWPTLWGGEPQQRGDTAQTFLDHLAFEKSDTKGSQKRGSWRPQTPPKGAIM